MTLLQARMRSLPSPREGRVTREGLMTKNSPHKQWKGCLLCAPHKHRGNGDAARTPWKVLRKVGVKRRYSRNETYWTDET